MCGFIGFTGYLENRKEIINKMMDRIVHRGPDMASDFLGDGVTLGFRRLSIIDLSEAGNQPMSSADGRYSIVFNGEIYNYAELKKELCEKGYVFRTEGDTEVLLYMLAEYGENALLKLRGMFAFAFWDADEKSILCARDFFGIKPFYYTRLKSGELLFGSEIKSFLEHPEFEKNVNEKALLPYLTFQYSSCDETFFKGVFKLPPAHLMRYKNGEIEIKRYYDINFEEKRTSLDECAKEIDKTVRDSVSYHKISDVKTGAFLSGGVDSSYITAAMMPDESFSVGFDYHKFNETDYAAELSQILKIKNYKRMLTADECFDALPDIQYHMDEPQSNPSSVPLYFLSKLASEHVTVVLSGEGADEIYGGYEWYDETPSMKKYKKLPAGLRRAAARVAKKLPYFKGHDFIIKCSGRPEDYFIGQAYVFPEKEARAVLCGEYKNGTPVCEITERVYSRTAGMTELEKKQYLDMNLWLPGDILLKADKMSMAHSLELRVPYLDRVVMEQAKTIPSEYKINGKNTKYVFRRAANLTIPDDWADRPKVGFPVPIRYWLKEDKYYNFAKEYFLSDSAAKFFETAQLMKLLDDHRSGKANNGRKIWTVLVFLVWYKRFFIDEK